MTLNIAVLTLETSVFGLASSYTEAVHRTLSVVPAVAMPKYRSEPKGFVYPELRPREPKFHIVEAITLPVTILIHIQHYVKTWTANPLVDWVIVIGGGVGSQCVYKPEVRP